VTGPGVDARMVLAREWDDLVGKVRGIGGFEDFLRPVRAHTLLSAAAAGPIAVLNVNSRRCDALLVTAAGVQNCPLPLLSLDDAADRLAMYVDLLQRLDVAVQTVVDARRAARVEPSHATALAAHRAGLAMSAAESAVDGMLAGLNEWMWDTIAKPILVRLGLTARPADGSTWPRVWWCPTGPLSLLPLHAAGYHRNSSPSAGARAVIDACVSSYTPTVHALLAARTQLGVSALQSVLVVAPSAAGGRSVLSGESAVLRGVTAAAALSVIEGEDATCATVLAELGRHTVAHFDCHGEQDLDDPSTGGLILADGRLTVLDVAGQAFRGDFAGLAACKTAVGGIALPDEAITLTASLHYTGYRHVVGSLWSIRDDVGTFAFDRLYRAMAAAGGGLEVDRSPQALHAVVRELRDEYLDMPRLWAPFIHVGP
jgi:hypothetical protein